MPFRPKSGLFPRVYTIAVLCLFFLGACGKPAGTNSSNDHLKAGLLALDRGDEPTAQRELQTSLDLNPKNADARVALASIYAHHAGLDMKAWLDPMLAAGKQVDSKLRAYDTAGDLRIRIDDDNSDDVAMFGELSPENRSKSLAQVRKEVQDIYANLGKVAIGVMISIDLFEALPYMSDSEQASLDHAIELLRQEDANPDNRSDKVKLYLAVLSLMKFIHNVRSFVGGFDHEARKIFSKNSHFCSIDAPEARAQVMAMHDSLLLVEEGLRVNGSADDARTRSRRQLHAFVKDRLLGPIWNSVDKFFIKGSEENFAAMRYLGRLCGIGKKPDAAIPGGPPGATLWDPDKD